MPGPRSPPPRTITPTDHAGSAAPWPGSPPTDGPSHREPPILRIRAFEEADRERWDDYVRSRPESHFGQLASWRELVLRTYGCRPLYFLAETEGRVRGVLPLFERSGREPALFSPPGGLLADDETVAAALLEPAREALARRRLGYLELRDQRRRWPDLETSEEHVTLVLELADDEKTQWRTFDAKLRNQIRKALKAGFETRWGPGEIPTFHRVMLENMRDLGTPIRDRRYYERTFAALGPAADVMTIRQGGEPAGAMFLVRHGDTLMDPWASSLRRFFAFCPNQMLYWEALRRAIALGLRRFDFGRSQWNSNTYRFKEQWGAAPAPLFYQYVLGRARRIPTLEEQKGGFALAVSLWKRLPLPLARALGEPAKRMFPEVL